MTGPLTIDGMIELELRDMLQARMLSRPSSVAADIMHEYVLIPRAEVTDDVTVLAKSDALPKVHPAYNGNIKHGVSCNGILATHRSDADRFRKLGLAHLALADAIPGLQEAKKAEDAKTAEAELATEAATLYAAAHDSNLAAWELELLLTEEGLEQWKKVAKTARTLYGPDADELAAADCG